MILGTRISNPLWSQRPLFTLSYRIYSKLNFFTSPSSAKVSDCLDGDDDFLPWLCRKAGIEISSGLSIGKSAHGRKINLKNITLREFPNLVKFVVGSLFASKSIEAGDCMLKVPYDVQIAQDNLIPEVNSLLSDEVGNVAKLAIIILFEQKMGQHSEWAPYISRLPQPEEMYCTIFWSEGELEMIQQSSVYRETNKRNTHIENQFLAAKPALDLFPGIFGDVTFKDFKHAYALVESRAWRSTKDFLNHDGAAEAVLLSDDSKELSEVIADRNYAPGDQVMIRYGKFSNATLLLDFGFTLPRNIYDEVQIQVDIPHHDHLCAMKLELLHEHCAPTIKDVNISSSWDSFTIKEVRSAKGKGRGIPQSLRAFARVLWSTSSQELDELATEAARNDGRLARQPLKNTSTEIQAHQFLLSRITQPIEKYNLSIKALGPPSSPLVFEKLSLRRQMARDLLTGELRVLKSASEWLKNYCASLSAL